MLRYYPGIFPMGLRKPTIKLDHGRRSPGRQLNPGPIEYEAGVLIARQRRSVSDILIASIVEVEVACNHA
jgi:hypothetical protein